MNNRSNIKKIPEFDPKKYIKNGNSVEDIIKIKGQFDIFDSEHKGYIDPKSTFCQY